MKIKNKPRLSFGLCAVGLIALAVSPASLMAQNTAAGVDVTNTASVSYDIDDIPQPPIPAVETFEVDAVINPVVATTADLTVAPGQTGVVIPYTVSNGGNQIQDFVLDVANRGDDDDDFTITAVWIDGGNGTFDSGAGDDTLVDLTDLASREATPITNISPGDPAVTVFIVGNVPATVADADDIDVDLIATAYTAGGGAIETETAPGDTDIDVVDTVFGDADGPADGANAATTDDDEDGQHSATGALTVGNVTVTLTKTAVVLDNGLDINPTDQFFIPGARVEYTITIAYSGAGTATANDIVMSDPMPVNTTYVAQSIELGGVDQTDEDDDPTDFADFNVTAADAVTVAITGTRTGASPDDVITFEVTID